MANVFNPSTSMPRESRHVLVSGLPENLVDEKISSFFSQYGGVQKTEKCDKDVIVSFMDVRSAQKAHAGEHHMDNGIQFSLRFYEPTAIVNGSMTGSIPSTSSMSSKQFDSKRRSPSPKKDIRQNVRPSQSAFVKRTARLECNKKDGRSPESGTNNTFNTVCLSGIQGVFVDLERIHCFPNDSKLKHEIRDCLKKYGSISDVTIDSSIDHRRALVIFNTVYDLEKLLVEKSIILRDQNCRLSRANAMEVQDAHSAFLAHSVMAASSRDSDLPARYSSPNGYQRPMSEVDIYNPKASRTVYIGGLECRQHEDSLRKRFQEFGDILDVDVKNFESPMPFAFVHFVDLDSAVRAVNFYSRNSIGMPSKKSKVNFGRPNATNRLTIGAITKGAPEPLVEQYLRESLDGVLNIIYDAPRQQAIVTFASPEHSDRARSDMRSREFVLKFLDNASRLSADFSSDGHFKYFQTRLANPPTSIAESEPVLVPPPDPPSDMSTYGHRYGHHRDHHRSMSHSRRRDRSHSRSGHRDRSRDRSRHRDRKTSRYDHDRESSSRRRDRKDRKRSSSNSSSRSSSSDSSKSDSSSSSDSSHPSAYSQHRDKKDKKRVDERRERERDRRPSNHHRNPVVPTKWPERRRPSDDEQHPPVAERPETSTSVPQERAASGDSGFFERAPLDDRTALEAKSSLDPPPMPPVIERTVNTGTSHVNTPPPPPPLGQRDPISPRAKVSLTILSPTIAPSRDNGEPSHFQDHSHPDLTKQRSTENIRANQPQSINGSHRFPNDPARRTSSTEEYKPHDKNDSQRNVPPGPYHDHTSTRSYNVVNVDKRESTHPSRWPWAYLLKAPISIQLENVSRTPILDPRVGRYPRVISDMLPLPPLSKCLELREKPKPLELDTPKKRPSITSFDMPRRTSSTSSRPEEIPSHRARDVVSTDDLIKSPPERFPSLSQTDFASKAKNGGDQEFRRGFSLLRTPPTPTSTTPAAPPAEELKVSGSCSSFKEKLKQVHDRHKTYDVRSAFDPFAKTSLTGPPPSLSEKPNDLAFDSPSARHGALEIMIPPASSSAVSSSMTPLSAKTDYSPLKQFSSKTSFTPSFGDSSSNYQQQQSPLLSAPPPPPQLPMSVRRESMSRKSPPGTPVTPVTLSQRPPTFPGRPPLQSTKPLADKERPPGHISSTPRHDSMFSLRSPLPGAPPVSRSHSVSEVKKPLIKEANNTLEYIVNNKGALSSEIRKLPKIEKKSSQSTSIDKDKPVEKVKEHKKSKEHKQRRKEDGTLETKEERAKRKELEKARKEKHKKEHKKDKKSKEDRKKSKEEEKEKKKEKKLKKEEKERMKSGKKRKKAAKSSDEESQDSDSDAEYAKLLAKQFAAEDGVVAGQSMYDRVKRRSSAATKDEPKRTLEALKTIREKNEKKKRNVHLDSSDEEMNSQKDSDDESIAGTSRKMGSGDEQLKLKKMKKTSLERSKEAFTSDSDSDSDSTMQSKSTSKKKAVNMDDVYGDSSDGEPPNKKRPNMSETKKKKKKKSHDKNDINFESIFGSEKHEKPKKFKLEKTRKRPADDEGKSAKRARKLSSMGSEASSDNDSTRKNRLLSKSSTCTEGDLFEKHDDLSKPSTSFSRHEDSDKPRLLTKAAVKEFASSIQSVGHSCSDDSEDDVAVGSSSVSDSKSRVLENTSETTSHSEDSDLDSHCSVPKTMEMINIAEECTSGMIVGEQSCENAVSVSPMATEREVEEVKEEHENRQEDPFAIVDSASHTEQYREMSYADEQETKTAVLSLFDENDDDQEPQYPSHDFIRGEEIAQEVTEAMIMEESRFEEPVASDDEDRLSFANDSIHEDMMSHGRDEVKSEIGEEEIKHEQGKNLNLHIDNSISSYSMKSPLKISPVGTSSSHVNPSFSPAPHGKLSLSSPSLTSPRSSVRSTPPSEHLSTKDTVLSPTAERFASPLGRPSPKLLDNGGDHFHEVRQPSLSIPSSPALSLNEDIKKEETSSVTGTSTSPHVVAFEPVEVKPPSPTVSPESSVASTSSLRPITTEVVPEPPAVYPTPSSLPKTIVPAETLLSRPSQVDLPTTSATPVIEDRPHIIVSSQSNATTNVPITQQHTTAPTMVSTTSASLSDQMGYQQQSLPLQNPVLKHTGQSLPLQKAPVSTPYSHPSPPIQQDHVISLDHNQILYTIQAVHQRDPESPFLLELCNRYRTNGMLTPMEQYQLLMLAQQRHQPSSVMPQVSSVSIPSTSASYTERPPGNVGATPSAVVPSTSIAVSPAIRHNGVTEKPEDNNISAVWRGQLLMKSHEAFVQLHLLAGGSSYLAGVIGSVMESMKTTKTIRISQRMKADTNQVKALLARLLRGEGAACLAVPVGHTLQECQYHNDNLKNQFVEYFSAKAAAGISMFTDDSDQKVTRDLAYVFPPGEFVESFIKEISFELYARIKSKQAPSFNYLFVIVVPADELHNSVATTAAANTST